MYRLIPDPDVTHQIASLPVEALDAYAAVLDHVERTPWRGSPQHSANPTGPLRRWTFGAEDAGQVIYLILEREQEVHLLLVQWWWA